MEAKTTARTTTAFDVEKIRKDFPALHQQVNNKPLVYLDNAATTQKPEIVIDAINRYYRETNSNVHRGVHYLSEKATQAYEEVRVIVKRFIGAADKKEIIFVRSATEGINLVASSYGRKNIQKGDEVIISEMEHHSNIVPWQMLCEEKNAKLRVIPISDDGELVIAEFEKLLSAKTKFVAVTHVSNTLGTINPVKKIIELAHQQNVPVLLDGAQAAPHLPIDVKGLDCDFYVLSGHKVFGPTGIGVLYGKEHFLESMPPYQGGGDMIKSVTLEKTDYNDLPYKFEAGTPNIAGTIGLGAAIDYLDQIGMENIIRHEQNLLSYATNAFSSVKKLRLLGTAKKKVSVISYIIDNIHPHDVGTVLDREGVAIRTGHHCTQPIMKRFGIPATSRASFAFYNTTEEVDILIKAIHKVIKMLG